MNHFKGKQFQQDVIIVAVGYYLRYNLSYREVQEILYDRSWTLLSQPLSSIFLVIHFFDVDKLIKYWIFSF